MPYNLFFHSHTFFILSICRSRPHTAKEVHPGIASTPKPFLINIRSPTPTTCFLYQPPSSSSPSPTSLHPCSSSCPCSVFACNFHQTSNNLPSTFYPHRICCYNREAYYSNHPPYTPLGLSIRATVPPAPSQFSGNFFPFFTINGRNDT